MAGALRQPSRPPAVGSPWRPSPSPQPQPRAAAPRGDDAWRWCAEEGGVAAWPRPPPPPAAESAPTHRSAAAGPPLCCRPDWLAVSLLPQRCGLAGGARCGLACVPRPAASEHQVLASRHPPTAPPLVACGLCRSAAVARIPSPLLPYPHA
ncbi:hypothetical protein I4F81_004177 [Pyropia yezoensis]|uniref:Uncharacterized protein n=1 Tax=Pyropia yezoensis TaxID=2788 RepID=A0ACC3BV61_PYRYE|nr:hypothetical protein I4F81_004177 [Neopyropia yezoensis]